MIRDIFRSLSNTQFSQRFYEKLYHLAMFGMNIGTGGKISTSGEEYLLQVINKRLENKTNLVLFDAGASKGHYLEYLLKYFKDRATIYAFEPSNEFYPKLLEYARDFPNVRTFQSALGDHAGQAKLYSSSSSAYLGSLVNRELTYAGFANDKVQEVKVTTLDEFCATHHITNIDFIKLDIEGWELHALLGARRLLDEGRIRMIQFEFGGANIDSRTSFKDFYHLLSPQYRLYRLLRKGLYEIKAYDDFLETFMAMNYFCERK